jgi:hypothetical protein
MVTQGNHLFDQLFYKPLFFEKCVCLERVSERGREFERVIGFGG